MQVRRDFRALAVWRGDVVTDAQGRATVTFTLPDSLTTYRLMAVATAGEEEFGAGESEVVVTKPLGLEPALPRFLRPEDKARAGVLVRNRTKPSPRGRGHPAARPRTVRCACAARRPGSSRCPAGGSLRGRLRAGRRRRRARPRCASCSSSPKPTPETDAFEVTLPVVALAPAETVATFFAITDRAEEQVAVPADVFPGAGGLEVRVAASPAGRGGGRRGFLADYPHACAEQVSSQVARLHRRGSPGRQPGARRRSRAPPARSGSARRWRGCWPASAATAASPSGPTGGPRAPSSRRTWRGRSSRPERPGSTVDRGRSEPRGRVPLGAAAPGELAGRRRPRVDRAPARLPRPGGARQAGAGLPAGPVRAAPAGPGVGPGAAGRPVGRRRARPIPACPPS